MITKVLNYIVETRLISRILLAFCLIIGYSYAENIEPLNVNAIINAHEIKFNPESIPENTPFMIHIINETGIPVELENADTSVEIYAGTDKTFKVGLTAGEYKFFNDFNANTKTAILHVVNKTSILNSTNSQPDIKVTPTLRVTDTQSYSNVNSNDSVAEIIFIMWRESIEALLVVGIVYSWLKQLKSGYKEGMLFLAAGTGIGVLCAIMLGLVLVKLNGVLGSNAQEYLQASLTFIAALMIVYMVKWMRSNGAKLKSGMYKALAQTEARRWNISILGVTTVAIAREGSEAVIFISALGFGKHGVVNSSMLSAVAIGLSLAILTIYLLSLGNKIFSWRYFFKITEILLLLLGGALFLNCVDLLITAGILPILKAKFWDTSFILSDGGRFAPMLTSIVGYRATPSLMDILAYIAYWRIVTWVIKVKPLAKVKI